MRFFGISNDQKQRKVTIQTHTIWVMRCSRIYGLSARLAVDEEANLCHSSGYISWILDDDHGIAVRGKEKRIVFDGILGHAAAPV